MSDLLPLPDPHRDVDELANLLPVRTLRDLYTILWATRSSPLTAVQIRENFAAEHGEQSQLDRRRRDLYRLFLIERIKLEGDSTPRYRLVGRLATPRHDAAMISTRTRAEVLRLGRCAQCGRNPIDHGVVLVVDHRIPQAWGGTHDIENLQALCEECNSGKKAYYATLNEHGESIATASAHTEVHRRLAALLEAVYPDEVRSDVLELVANFGEVQEDWQKRLRELRKLGWDYEVRRQRDADGRVRAFYRLTSHPPLPDGLLRPHIRRAEGNRK